MKHMSISTRRACSDAGHRSRHGRTFVALIAATALTLGPGALTAFADDSAPTPVVVEPAAAPAPVAEVVAPEPPAPAPAEAAPAPVEVVPPPVEPAEVTPPPEVVTPPAEDVVPPTDSVDAVEPEPAAATATETPESTPPASARVATDTAKTGGDDNPHNKIKICHATGSENNPFVVNRPNANGTVDGHAGMDHQNGEDIIPPFDYNEDGQNAHFPGQNWDEGGQAIYNNGCNLPVPEPMDPVISVTPPVCVPVGQPVPTMIAVSLEDLMVGSNYSVEISRDGWSDSVDFVAEGMTAMVDVPVNGLGAYTVTVYGPEQLSDSAWFSFTQCEGPDPRDNVSFCHAVTDYPEVAKFTSFADFLYYEFLTLPKGEILDGHAGVHPDDIIPPFSYFDGESPVEFLGQNWDEHGQMLLRNDCEELVPVPVVNVDIVQCTGPNGVVPSTVLVTIGSLVVGDDYTLLLNGPMGLAESTPFTATAETMEFEQAVNGPGDFVAEVSSDSEDPVMDMQAFTVNPQCAVKTPPVVTTSSPKPPMLVSTGVDGEGPNLAAAILLLAGGSLLTAAGVRRAARSRG